MRINWIKLVSLAEIGGGLSALIYKAVFQQYVMGLNFIPAVLNLGHAKRPQGVREEPTGIRKI